jgi:hypothetical protein
MGISAVLAHFGMALAGLGVPGSTCQVLPCDERLKPGLLAGAVAPLGRRIAVATAAPEFTPSVLRPRANATPV